MRPWLRVVRGCRKLVAHFSPQSCPVCLEELPLVGLVELPPAAASAKEQSSASATFVRLRRCKHKFCSGNEHETGSCQRDRVQMLTLCTCMDCRLHIAVHEHEDPRQGRREW